MDMEKVSQSPPHHHYQDFICVRILSLKLASPSPMSCPTSGCNSFSFCWNIMWPRSDEKIVRTNSMRSISSMGPIHKKHSVSLISVNRWVKSLLNSKLNIDVQDQGGVGSAKFTVNGTSSASRFLWRPTTFSQTPSHLTPLEVNVIAVYVNVNVNINDRSEEVTYAGRTVRRRWVDQKW